MGQLIVDFYVMIIRPLITLYTYVIIANVVMSWLVSFNIVNPRNQIVAAIYRTTYVLTEPLLRPIRNLLPAMAGLDFSPVILLLILWYLNGSVLPWLFLSLARAVA